MTATKCQQGALYAAEETVRRGRTFTGLDDIQLFVDTLRDNRWWSVQGFWVVERVEVGPARKNSGSVGWYEKDKNAGRIEMAEVHWCKLFVLHELAHVLAEALHGSKSHDPAFARTYLTLVYNVMGPTTYAALQRAFDRHEVNYDFTTVPESRFAL